jgi:hypothetical protein
VSRLCDPIEGTDAARIAESLGAWTHAFKMRVQKLILCTYDMINENGEVSVVTGCRLDG